MAGEWHTMTAVRAGNVQTHKEIADEVYRQGFDNDYKQCCKKIVQEALHNYYRKSQCKAYAEALACIELDDNLGGC